jgi:hypothetical protein
MYDYLLVLEAQAVHEFISLLTNNGQTLAIVDFMDHYAYPAHHINQFINFAFAEVVTISDTPDSTSHRTPTPKNHYVDLQSHQEEEEDNFQTPIAKRSMDKVKPTRDDKKSKSHKIDKKAQKKKDKNVKLTDHKNDLVNATDDFRSNEEEDADDEAEEREQEDQNEEDQEDHDHKKKNGKKEKKDSSKKKSRGKKRERDAVSDDGDQLPAKKQKRQHKSKAVAKNSAIPDKDSKIYAATTKSLLKVLYDSLYPSGRICNCLNFFSFMDSNDTKKKGARKACSGGVKCFWTDFICPCGIPQSQEIQGLQGSRKNAHLSTCAVFRKLLLETTIDIQNTYRIGPVGDITRKNLQIDLDPEIHQTVMAHFEKKMCEVPEQQKTTYDELNTAESVNPVYRDAKLLWNLDEDGVSSIIKEQQKYDAESYFFCPLCGTVVRTSGRFYEHLREAYKVPCKSMQAKDPEHTKEIHSKFVKDFKASVIDTYKKTHTRMTEWARHNGMRANERAITAKTTSGTISPDDASNDDNNTMDDSNSTPKLKKSKARIADEELKNLDSGNEEESKEKDEESSKDGNASGTPSPSQDELNDTPDSLPSTPKNTKTKDISPPKDIKLSKVNNSGTPLPNVSTSTTTTTTSSSKLPSVTEDPLPLPPKQHTDKEKNKDKTLSTLAPVLNTDEQPKAKPPPPTQNTKASPVLDSTSPILRQPSAAAKSNPVVQKGQEPTAPNNSNPTILHTSPRPTQPTLIINPRRADQTAPAQILSQKKTDDISATHGSGKLTSNKPSPQNPIRILHKNQLPVANSNPPADDLDDASVSLSDEGAGEDEDEDDRMKAAALADF